MRRRGCLTLCAALLAVADGQAAAWAQTGARHHFAPPPREPAEQGLTDELERALWQTVKRAAGAPAPSLDARLTLVAKSLARTWPQGAGHPDIEHQEFLLSHHGLGDPPPHILGVRVTASDGAIRNRMAELLPDLLARTPSARVGVGVARRFWNKGVVLLVQGTYVEMLPVPRQLPADGSAMIAGRVLSGIAEPRVLVAPPWGEVETLPVRASRDSFQTIFQCNGRKGRHQIEIMGKTAAGRAVLANFPAWCGVPVPATAPPFASGSAETLDPVRAAALVADRVNADRRAAGVSVVAWDEALARVARAHSENMAGKGAVAHVLPDTGDAAERVRRAGVRVTIVLENVARATSVAEAQRSFMSSPGHRANVLSRSARRMGAGVAVRSEAGGARMLYVTQLFAP